MAKEKKQSAFVTKWKVGVEKFRSITASINRVLAIVGKVLFHMRRIFLTVPVVLLAMEVFRYAKENLPQEVGLLLQENGQFKYLLDRNTAMSCCLAVTGACLLLMYMSRKTIYPWLISIFSLILPIFLIVSNIFPA